MTSALRIVACALGVTLTAGAIATTEAPDGVFGDPGRGADPRVMGAQGTPRVVDFRTREGTSMSLDISPDGHWIVFDLLGHIYRMPTAGGVAQCLTQGSGVALNMQPRYSPDGRRIAFVSDRSGQANVWIMAADGSAPAAVYLDADHRYTTPVWARDGQSLFATRLAPTPGQGWHRRNASIWRLPLQGVPLALLESVSAQYYATSTDGRTLYLYASSMARSGASIYETDFHLQALDLTNLRIRDVLATRRPPSTAVPSADVTNYAPRLAYDSGAGPQSPADISPTVSPDGRWLAFARALEDGAMTYRGHRYRHRTALFLADLANGTERKLLDPITKDFTNTHAHYTEAFLPNFAWTADSAALVISLDGKIAKVRTDGSPAAFIPFEATVHRVVSQQARRQAGLDPDNAVPVRFIQWPTASPDGHYLAFVALGRIWGMDLPDGAPHPLTPDPGPDVQLTPAWSADGAHLAFATWNDHDRGKVWVLDVATHALTAASSVPGEYIWPTWAPDGHALLAIRGPEPREVGTGWNAPLGWGLVRLEAGIPKQLSRGGTPWQPIGVSREGRIYVTVQADPTVNDRLELPYPDAADLELGSWTVTSVDTGGGTPHAELAFPAGPSEFAVPLVSPDGRWVAYQSDYRIFAEKLPFARRSKSLLWIDPSPHSARPERIRLDLAGGVYPRWHNDHTIEYAAGNDYVSFDLTTGARRTVHVALEFKRDRAPGTLALINSKIISMDRDRVINRGTLVVRDGRLACVGACSIDGIEHVVDLRGKTVIPGLIDVHDHIAQELSGVVPLRRPVSLLALAYGVTTVIDPAVSSTTLFPLAEMTDAGRILGPRTLGSGDAVFGSVGGLNGTASSSFGALVDLDSAADAEYQVARRAAWGAVTIKNFRQTRREQQQWLVAAARRHGVSVTAEGGSMLTDLSMIMDGQTGWEHYLPAMPLYHDMSRFIGEVRATFSPTLSVAGFPDGAMFYYRSRAKLPSDPKYTRFASPGLLSAVAPRNSADESLDSFSFPILAEGVADVLRAGGYATVGEHGENPGIGTHWEMWAYATAVTPLEAIRMATINGARFVGVERELGSLEVGKLADLVVLNSDPLVNIENTSDIAYVMKSGHLYDGQTLSESAATAAALTK